MFDDQIKRRKQQDDEMLRDMYASFAGVVLGSSVQNRLRSDDALSKDAVDAVLKFYHAKQLEVPETIVEPFERLNYLCRTNGIMYRNVKLEKDWFKDAIGAHIGILKSDGSVVALLPGKLSGYCFFDKTNGKWTKVNHRNQELFEETGICFYQSFPMRKLGTADLLNFVKNCFGFSDIVFTVLMTMIVALIGAIGPKMMNLLYGDVLNAGRMDVLMAVLVFMLFTTIGRILIGLAKTIVFANVTAKLDIEANAAAIQRLLQMPAPFFRNYTAGELTSYINLISDLCSNLFSIIFSTGLTSLFAFIYIFQIFQYAPSLVVPTILVILGTMSFTVVSALVSIRYNVKMMKTVAKTNGFSYSLIDGVRKIRLAGSEKRAFAKWGESYREVADIVYNMPVILKYGSVFSLAISLVGTIVIYFIAGSNQIELSHYVAFNSAYGMISAAFMSLAGITTSIASIHPTIEIIKPLMNTAPEVNPDKKVVTGLNGEIELKGVSFRYDDNSPNIIDNLSLHVHQGEYVALVGRTGCGKSTLIRLLLGLEKAQKGTIYYDNMDLNNLDLMSLRGKIGTVTQNGMLFMGKIRDNISITLPEMTLEEVWEAAETAGIAEDIRKMPMGMNTYVYEGGAVSGGQKQRILIARAIAPKPAILIFDEATSALDNLTQKQVSEALDDMKCTRIVVAHRLSTIRLCDRIIVLDGGKIVEEGTFEELSEKNGLFSELIKRQR